MLAENAKKIMTLLKPEDIVLDIGGWAQPFRRANYVMDAQPYETRGFYRHLGLPDSIGGGPECFTKTTWIQRDICEKTPFPFKDKSIDFVICSHTLEDVRDPLWVCSEMQRVAKRGYLEIPSRAFESCKDSKTGLAGSAHHRWLIEIEDGRICFEMKYHLIHLRQHHFPSYVRYLLKPSERIQFLFWVNSFEYFEAPIPLSDSEIKNRLRTFTITQWPKRDFQQRIVARLKAWVSATIPGSLRKALPLSRQRGEGQTDNIGGRPGPTNHES